MADRAAAMNILAEGKDRVSQRSAGFMLLTVFLKMKAVDSLMLSQQQENVRDEQVAIYDGRTIDRAA